MAAVFDDPAVEPTPKLIETALGAANGAWEELADLLAAVGAKAEWRYYRDGGWLVKAVKGSKTVAWLQVNDGYGRITCYLAARHRETLANATDLPEDLRTKIAQVKTMAKTLPVTLEVRTLEEAATAGVVVAYKASLK